MKWLIILLGVNGEPAIVTGWEPMQVDAERCERIASRTSAYITVQMGMDNAVVCADDLNQQAIEKALAQFGVGL